VSTTFELPEPLFRLAEQKAQERGIPVQQFVTEIVEEKLRDESGRPAEPSFSGFGKLAHLRDDLHRINQIVEEEFEQIEPDEWT
jgi:hypothetical protein